MLKMTKRLSFGNGDGNVAYLVTEKGYQAIQCLLGDSEVGGSKVTTYYISRSGKSSVGYITVPITEKAIIVLGAEKPRNTKATEVIDAEGCKWYVAVVNEQLQSYCPEKGIFREVRCLSDLTLQESKFLKESTYHKEVDINTSCEGFNGFIPSDRKLWPLVAEVLRPRNTGVFFSKFGDWTLYDMGHEWETRYYGIKVANFDLLEEACESLGWGYEDEGEASYTVVQRAGLYFKVRRINKIDGSGDWSEVSEYEFELDNENDFGAAYKKARIQIKHKILWDSIESESSLIREFVNSHPETVLKISDSHEVGNCEIGTKSFCDKYLEGKTEVTFGEIQDNRNYEEMMNNHAFKRVIVKLIEETL